MRHQFLEEMIRLVFVQIHALAEQVSDLPAKRIHFLNLPGDHLGQERTEIFLLMALDRANHVDPVQQITLEFHSRPNKRI
jgi:hypothetical protein